MLEERKQIASSDYESVFQNSENKVVQKSLPAKSEETKHRKQLSSRQLLNRHSATSSEMLRPDSRNITHNLLIQL